MPNRALHVAAALMVLAVVSLILLLSIPKGRKTLQAEEPVTVQFTSGFHLKISISGARLSQHNDMIPKVIWRIWSHDNIPDLPAMFQGAIQQTQQANTDWQQVIVTDAHACRIIAQMPPAVQNAYYSLNPEYGPARADLLRYVIMWLYGGLYLDMKSTAVGSVSDVIRTHDQLVLSKWGVRMGQHRALERHRLPYSSRNGEYQQWYVLAAPHHPLIHEVITSVVRNCELYRRKQFPFNGQETGKDGVLELTGPTAFTIAIDKAIPRLWPHVTFRIAASDLAGILKYTYAHGEQHTLPHVLGSQTHYSRLKTPIVLNIPQSRHKLTERCIHQIK